MQNFKFITVILGLLSSFVTMAADNSIINDGNTVTLSGGTSTARVIAPKAIVYADENMLSPLGYIGNGKAVVVGSPRRMNRDLVPIVVYGRLAFIEVKDIRYEDTANEEYNMKRGAPREHNFDIVLEKPTEKLSVNNSMFLSLHTYNAGDDVKNVFLNIDGADKTAMTGFAFQLIHRNEGSRIFWGAGVDYSTISTSNVQFAYWLVSPTLGYSFLRNKLFVLDLYASLDLAPNTVFEIENNYKSDPAGFVWGIQGNARIVLFPENRYHITGAIGLRKYSVSGISDIEDGNGVIYPGISGLTSVSLSLGLGFEFF